MTFKPEDHLTDLNKNPKNPRLYLETKWRLVWFKADHPNGRISTEVLQSTPALVKATVLDSEGSVLATGHGTALAKAGAVWAGREIEKAETAAIGRALAHAGYGTQFTGENDEDALVDSPVSKIFPSSAPKAPASPPPTPATSANSGGSPDGDKAQNARGEAVQSGQGASTVNGSSSASIAPKHPQIGALDMPKLFRKSSLDGRSHFDALIHKLLNELHTINNSSTESDVLEAITAYYMKQALEGAK